MKKKFKLHLIPIIISFVFLAACSGGKSDDSSSASTSNTNTVATTDAAPTTATPASPKPALVGNLYRLVVPRADFAALPDNRRLVLAHTFRSNPDILTLYGWPCKNRDCDGGDFDPLAPSIKFKKGIATGQTYGPDVIFSNVFIDRKHIKDIKDFKDANGNYYAFVVLIPQRDGEYIKYSIHVTNDPASLAETTPKTLVDTGFEANPSPPRN